MVEVVAALIWDKDRFLIRFVYQKSRSTFLYDMHACKNYTIM